MTHQLRDSGVTMPVRAWCHQLGTPVPEWVSKVFVEHDGKLLQVSRDPKTLVELQVGDWAVCTDSKTCIVLNESEFNRTFKALKA